METVLQELIKEFGTYDNVEMKCVTIQNLLRNKLRKEKQQIIDAFEVGNDNFGGSKSENYFNETFNS